MFLQVCLCWKKVNIKIPTDKSGNIVFKSKLNDANQFAMIL